MWAQMLKSRLKPGQESALQQVGQEMESMRREQGSALGPERVILMQDQNDQNSYITLIFFESEAKAREFERSNQQNEVQERMMQIWEGPPEYTDLNVISEYNA